MKRQLNQLLVVVPWLENGGASKALMSLLSHVPKERVTIVRLFKSSQELKDFSHVSSNQIEFNCPKNIAGILIGAVRLRMLVRNYDSIYSLMRASHSILGILSIGALKTKKFIATIHSNPHFDNSSLVGKLENIFVSRALKRAVLISSPSNFVVEKLKQSNLGKIDGIKIAFCPNYIEFPRVPVSQKSLHTGKYMRLVFIGRLSHEKGISDLLQWLRSVKKPVHLKIAGTGPQIEHLRNLATRFESVHKIEFLGQLNSVWDLLDWCQFLVLPSKTELSPLVVWEAWARGRHVLGTRIEAFFELQSFGPLTLIGDGAELDQFLRSSKFHLLLDDALKSGPAAVTNTNSKNDLLNELLVL
jgi:glycosyltransferase involved in cell wall biosynthesis